MNAAERPPVGRWCAGEAGALYLQALLALEGVLDRAGDTHWRNWVRADIDAWQRTATTDHFRSAFGGMGSLNDLYLADSSDPNSIWLDAAMRAARSIAAGVAATAAAEPSTFRQVPPSSSMLGASCYHCRTCTDTFVMDAAHLWPAAEGWASWRVAVMLQDGTGAHVAAEALGERDPDLRPTYLAFAKDVLARSTAKLALVDHYPTWRCPTCGDHNWTTGNISVF